MPAPKGHPPYAGCEKGGYLGRGENYYTDEDLRALGEGLIEWIQQKNNIFCKFYFAPKGILWAMVHKLGARSPMFKAYLDQAKEIQECKLVTEPYLRRADANHARFVLARHHKGEWEEKPVIIAHEDEKKLVESMDLVTYLQSKSDLKIADSKISSDDKS